MASRKLISDDNEYISGTFYEYDFYWGVERNVGWGCENNYDDVLLIQYLINSLEIMDKLVEDGAFGPKTSKAIKRFQTKFNRKYPHTCVVDGQVNAAQGDVFYVPGSKQLMIYTIYMLNFWYLEKKRIYYRDIRMDPKLPNELCQLMLLSDY